MEVGNRQLLFPEPLREGVILARPNRFIMDVDFGGGEVVCCHCPVVSRIGGLDLAGRPCLVSDSHNPKRKMPLTVEAFSLDLPGAAQKRWIGINQNASNRYVEHFLSAGAFDGLLGPVREVRREVPLGESKLDFLVNDAVYLEVKTPLVQIQTDIPAYVPRLPEAPFSSTERAMRHLRELAASLKDHERAVILYCLYCAPVAGGAVLLHRAGHAPPARVGGIAEGPRAGCHPLLPLLRELRLSVLPRHHLRRGASHRVRLREGGR